MASGRQTSPKFPQGNTTSGDYGFTGGGKAGDANLGPELYSDYTTDFEIDDNDPVFDDYCCRIGDNDEILPEEYDFTSFRADQSDWSMDNLPEILYVLEPRPGDIKTRTPDMIDHPFFPNLRVREFEVLPDQISSKVEGWRVIAWLRMDSRIKARDIVDRMYPRAFEAARGYTRADWFIKVLCRVAWRCKQTYNAFNIVRWWNKDTTHLNKVIKLLEDAGIGRELNTTRGITPGIIEPLRPQRGRIPIPIDYRKRFFYETAQLPPPPPPRKPVPNFPPYPAPPGEESDEDETQSDPKGQGSNQSISPETTRENDSTQLLKEFQTPKS